MKNYSRQGFLAAVSGLALPFLLTLSAAAQAVPNRVRKGEAPSKDTVLKKKMQEVIDRQEIWQLMQRYARGADRADAELLRSVYWPDAIDDHGTFVGTPEQFITYSLGNSAHRVYGHHAVTTHTCELDGDNAYAETYFLAINVAEPPPFMMSTGRYIDHVQRRNGEWRIANRVTVIEGRYDVQDSKLHPTLQPLPGENERKLSTHDRSDVSYDRPLRPRQPKS